MHGRVIYKCGHVKLQCRCPENGHVLEQLAQVCPVCRPVGELLTPEEWQSLTPAQQQAREDAHEAQATQRGLPRACPGLMA